MRYLLVGLASAMAVALWEPAWYVVLIAFWVGSTIGLVAALIVGLFDFAVRDSE